MIHSVISTKNEEKSKNCICYIARSLLVNSFEMTKDERELLFYTSRHCEVRSNLKAIKEIASYLAMTDNWRFCYFTNLI